MKKHIKFYKRCIDKAELTFNGMSRNETTPTLRYPKEFEAEFYNLCQIALREIDGMTESEFDAIMKPIRFARKTLSIHNPDELEWDDSVRMCRKTKTYTASKDDVLNKDVAAEAIEEDTNFMASE